MTQTTVSMLNITLKVPIFISLKESDNLGDMGSDFTKFHFRRRGQKSNFFWALSIGVGLDEKCSTIKKSISEL